MPSMVEVDEIHEKTADSGVTIKDDLKLSSGNAITNASGADLLTEAGVLGSSVVFPAGMIIGSGALTDTTTGYDTNDSDLTCTDVTCTINKQIATSHILVMGMLNVQIYQDTTATSARANWWFDRTAPSVVTKYSMALAFLTDEDSNDPYHSMTSNSAIHFVDSSTGTTGAHTYVCHIKVESHADHHIRINHPDIGGTTYDGHSFVQAFEIAQ